MDLSVEASYSNSDFTGGDATITGLAGEWPMGVTSITVQAGNNVPPVFVDEAPVMREVEENSAEGMAVGEAVTASDPDSNDPLIYTLGGADGGQVRH